MANVEITRHLYAFFPHLEGKTLTVEAGSVAELVGAMEALAPGFAFYVCDEQGRLRRHVNVFVDGEMIRDRRALTDPLSASARVHIMQALSGG